MSDADEWAQGETGARAGMRVEKTMALSRGELNKTLEAFVGAALPAGEDSIELRLGPGRVRLRFEPLAPVRLGGLLELPRARLLIEFRDVDAGDREAFLDRFDLAFRRGGG